MKTNFLLNLLILCCSILIYVSDLYDETFILLLIFTSIINSIFFIYKIGRISNTFWFIIVYIFLFDLTPVMSLLGMNANPPEKVMLLYQFFALSGISLFQMAALCTLGRRAIQKTYDINFKKLEKCIFITFLLMFAACIMWIYDFGGVNIDKAIRISQANHLSMVADYLSLFCIPIYLFVPSYLSKRRSLAPLLLVCFLIAQYIDFSINKSRSDFIMSLVALLMGFLYVKKIFTFNSCTISDKERSTSPSLWSVFYKWLIPIALIGVILRFVRGQMQGVGEVSLSLDDLWSYIALSFGMGGDESGDFSYGSVIYKLISNVPSTHEFLYGQSYYRIFFTWIPRLFWGDKPLNTETIVGSWLYPDIVGMVVPPGVIGDAYINFGVIGVFLMFFFGIIFGRLDKQDSCSKLLFPFVSGVLIFHFVRGSFTTSIVEMLGTFYSVKLMVAYMSPKKVYLK